MANNAFDRTIINTRERPASSDINRLVSESDRTLREVLTQIFLSRAVIYPDDAAAPITGFVGGGFKTRPAGPPAMAAVVKAGIGFVYDPATASDINGISGVNDLSQWKPITLNADHQFNLPAAPSAPNTRIDIIEVKTNRLVGEPSSRDVLNISTGVFDPASVNKTLSWSLDNNIGQVTDPAQSTAALSLKIGVAGNPGLEPSPSAGYTKISRINVGSAPITTLDADTIVDYRRMLCPGGTGQFAAMITMAAGGIPVIMTRLHAPPGLVVSAVGISNNPVSVELYFFPGDATIASPLCVANAIAAGTIQTATIGLSATGLVDSVIQSAVAGVNASPQVKVAIGQPYWKFLLYCVANGAATLNSFRVVGHMML